jgi:protocatechuate 3,4-dioxygenase beta subunit
MPRPPLAALLLFAAVVLGLSLWWLLGDVPPTLPPTDAGPGANAAADADAQAAPVQGLADGGNLPTGDRAATRRSDDVLDDPEIRAGLSGFKGRVVDHQKRPVADCGVRLYRGALDSVLPQQIDLFAAAIDNPPQFVAGEVQTDAEGRFALTGVWPRAFYLLFAGLGTDAPVHQIVTQHPAPGQIVDLGDIALPLAGVLTGEVTDDDGEPLAGALVRAADLPGTLASLFPAERIDPEGALLVREPQFPMNVVEMPRWAKDLFDKLPIPTAYTDPEGRFRLVGVVPGSNMLATTMAGFLSDVKPSVPVRAGQTKDVGRIKLRRGEELVGKVVDGDGKPVADAEVFAGSTLGMAPVDLASRIAPTNAEGRFRGSGFGPGKVTVAARRGKGHPWTLAEPQPILGEVVVTLPTLYAVDVTVTLADGKPAKDARLQLLPGKPGEGAAEMFLLGVSQPVELRERRKAVGEGRWRIENLAKGVYTLLADAPGHAMASARIDIVDKSTSATLTLPVPYAFTVAVVGPDDKPIRNAMVYAQPRGDGPLEMPVAVGRTDDKGVRKVESLQADSLRVTAEHPKWGAAHGTVEKDASVTLRMQAPGALRGMLRENGAAPKPGEFTITLEKRGGDRGATEQVPILLTPGLDGAFASPALQPGEWRVSAIPALDALRSPGGMMAMVQTAFLSRNMPNVTVRVESGMTADAVLDGGEKPVEGPTATLAGSLTVDGKLGVGYALTAYGNNRMFSARVDERGRFDFGTVTAGAVQLNVLPPADQATFGPMETLWSNRVELKEGEARELPIEVMTSSLSGVCIDTAGQPVAGALVRAEGRIAAEGATPDKEPRTTNASTSTNAQGQFTFERVAAGTWRLDVRTRRGGARGELADIQVAAGAPVVGLQLVVLPTITVKGRVDLSALGANRRWAWVQSQRVVETGDKTNARGGSGFGIDNQSGEFSTSDLTPGRYALTLYCGSDDSTSRHPLGELLVPAGGLDGVVLRPGPQVEPRVR